MTTTAKTRDETFSKPPLFRDGKLHIPITSGPVARFNRDGREEPQKHLPKEPNTIAFDWRWFEFHGKDRVERIEPKDRTYWRYPRKLIPPPEVGFEIVRDSVGTDWIASEHLYSDGTQDEIILHTTNLLLEIYGEAHILEIDGTPLVAAPKVKRLAWDLLPPGTRGYELSGIPFKVKQRNVRVATRNNLSVFLEREPERIYYGMGTFTRYIALEYPNLNLVFLESPDYGNATYVFRGPWKEAAQLTKREVLENILHDAWVPHTTSWKQRIEAIFWDAERLKQHI